MEIRTIEQIKEEYAIHDQGRDSWVTLYTIVTYVILA